MVWISSAVASHPDTVTFLADHALEAENLDLVYPPVWTRSADALHGQMGARGVINSAFPISAAIDRLMVDDSRPSAYDTDFYLCFKAAGIFAPINVAVLRIDNAAEVSGGITASIQTADADDFGTNLSASTSLGTATSDKRLIVMMSTQYASTTRWRLHLTAGSNFIPQVSEFWIGPRRNIPVNIRAPYDEQSRESRVSINRSDGGVPTIYPRSTRGRKGVWRWEYQSTTIRDTFRTIEEETETFSKPFIAIEKPNSDASGTCILCVSPDARFEQPFESWALSARTAQIAFEECAPYRIKEV